MLAQRLATHSLRQFTARHNARVLGVSKPALTPTSSIGLIQRRLAATETTDSSEAQEILVQQRLRRPVSPHLSIYRPQITWYGSALNRITGATLSGGFYIFGAAYLVAPLFGWHLESASLAAAFGSLPIIVKLLTKFTLAFPFTYHSLNGIRHLVWDLGYQFSNRQVARTGWTVVALSILTSGLLVFL